MNPDSQKMGMAVDSALPVITERSDEREVASFRIKYYPCVSNRITSMYVT